MKLLSSIPSLITAVTSLIVVYAVLYDWAYFSAIDLRFFAALSLSDHVVSSLSKIPSIAIGLFIAFLLHHFFFIKSFTLESASNFVAYRDDEAGVSYIAQRPSIIVTFLLLVVTVITYLKGLETSLLLNLLLIFIWLWVYDFLLSRNKELQTKSWIMAVYLFPVLMIFALCTGVGAANRDLMSDVGEYTLIESDKNRIEGVRILRFTSNGVIYRNVISDNILLVNWSLIDSFHTNRTVESKDYMCEWVDWCS